MVTWSLRDIIEEVNTAFPDGHILKQFERLAGEDDEAVNVHEALAICIVQQVKDLYDPKSSSKSNMKRISTARDFASLILKDLSRRLE